MKTWTKPLESGPIQAAEKGVRQANHTIEGVTKWWNTCRKYCEFAGGNTGLARSSRKMVSNHWGGGERGRERRRERTSKNLLR